MGKQKASARPNNKPMAGYRVAHPSQNSKLEKKLVDRIADQRRVLGATEEHRRAVEGETAFVYELGNKWQQQAQDKWQEILQMRKRMKELEARREAERNET